MSVFRALHPWVGRLFTCYRLLKVLVAMVGSQMRNAAFLWWKVIIIHIIVSASMSMSGESSCWGVIHFHHWLPHARMTGGLDSQPSLLLSVKPFRCRKAFIFHGQCFLMGITGKKKHSLVSFGAHWKARHSQWAISIHLSWRPALPWRPALIEFLRDVNTCCLDSVLFNGIDYICVNSPPSG